VWPCGGDEAERDQGFGLLGDNLEAGLDRLDELVDGFDHVSAVTTAMTASGVALQQDSGGEADRVGGVAALGLAQHVAGGELGDVLEDRIAVGGAGADEDAVGGEQGAQALVGELQ